MADILAAEFNVAPPKVVIGGRRKKGAAYYPGFKTIYIPFQGTWRGTEHSMLHEFAHHLTDAKTDWRLTRPHGREFIECLRVVVLAWFGDLDKYNWKTEYKSIRAWYDRRAK
jgi:putative metallohydrolase (TIGR04338 family)